MKLSRSATIPLFLLVTCGVLAQQADRSRTEALVRRAADRLRALQQEADQLAATERTVLGELRAIEVERQIRLEELAQIRAGADETAREMASTTARIDRLGLHDEAARPALRARLVDLYKLGRARYLRLLLSTSDVRQIGRASRMVGSLAQADRRRVADHRQTLDALRLARERLDADARRLQRLQGDTERAARAAAAAARARTELVRTIDGRRDLNAQLAGQLQQAQQALQVTLSQLSAGAAPVAEPPFLPIGAFRGALDWPVAGPIRRRFRAGSAATSSQANGIDISSTKGTAVRAVHEGLVAYAGLFAGFGALVIVDHGARTFSLYGDLLDVAVGRGVRVDRGTIVGTVGAAPTGPPGLYFELRVDGEPVDPLQWLQKR